MLTRSSARKTPACHNRKRAGVIDKTHVGVRKHAQHQDPATANNSGEISSLQVKLSWLQVSEQANHVCSSLRSQRRVTRAHDPLSSQWSPANCFQLFGSAPRANTKSLHVFLASLEAENPVNYFYHTNNKFFGVLTLLRDARAKLSKLQSKL